MPTKKTKEIKRTRKIKKKKFIYAIGRRKTASARVRLFAGKGESLVNGKPLKDYFSGEVFKTLLEKPFEATETKGKYFITSKVLGSGKQAQLGAVVHGIARALEKENRGKFRPLLKQAGLLTRDSRMKERRKPGLAQSARAKKQSPKR
ncbi:MAG: 30S ribosomal protein S9 [Patescibacteria group bacterium]|nr:30S ribosomal protein S9 [Patescibacteria group bacterium]